MLEFVLIKCINGLNEKKQTKHICEVEEEKKTKSKQYCLQGSYGLSGSFSLCFWFGVLLIDTVCLYSSNY